MNLIKYFVVSILGVVAASGCAFGENSVQVVNKSSVAVAVT